MPAKDPRPDPQKASPSVPGAPGPAGGAAALTDAARAWSALVDGWWRQQSAVLPPDLERAMTATLDQSKALVDMACAQAATAIAGPPASANPAQARESDDSPAGGEYGLWQPVIDACRACEASLVGITGGRGSKASGAAREYQRAANAYLNEFVQINRDVAQRLQRKIGASPPADFRQLHALVVEEAENAYLDRVSGDAFAARQAAFINAMFRLRREMAEAGTAGDP